MQDREESKTEEEWRKYSFIYFVFAGKCNDLLKVATGDSCISETPAWITWNFIAIIILIFTWAGYFYFDQNRSFAILILVLFSYLNLSLLMWKEDSWFNKMPDSFASHWNWNWIQSCIFLWMRKESSPALHRTRLNV